MEVDEEELRPTSFDERSRLFRGCSLSPDVELGPVERQTYPGANNGVIVDHEYGNVRPYGEASFSSGTRARTQHTPVLVVREDERGDFRGQTRDPAAD